MDNANWASNSALDQGSDFYVANQGDNTIVRMQQNGTVIAIRRVTVNGHALEDVSLNGIAASVDASTIFATFVDPNTGQGVFSRCRHSNSARWAACALVRFCSRAAGRSSRALGTCNDKSTSRFMESFNANLKSDAPKADAVREARLQDHA